MSNPINPWHYPRGELSDELFRWFQTGLVRRVAMFAPRRKGKTWFLIRDLAPACIKKRYVPVYASLWSAPDTPHTPVIDAIRSANEALSQSRTPWKRYLKQLQSVAISVGGLTANWMPGMTDPVAATTSDLGALNAGLAELVQKAPNEKIVLMIDESQHLVTSPKFSAFTHSLRTALDTIEAAGRVQFHTLFTGSSRTNLDRMLRDPGAPFYQSVQHLDLPDLGRDYTDFVTEQLKRLGSVRPLSRDSMWEAFVQVDRSPYYMELIIRSLMLRQTRNLSDALAQTVESMTRDPQLTARWKTLRAIDRLVYLDVCDGSEIYSEEPLDRYSVQIGEPITIAKVQSATRRLQRLGLLSKRARGQYQNEDPELFAWGKRQANKQ